MARFDCDFSDYAKKIAALGDNAENVLKKAVYVGGGTAVSSIRGAISSMPTIANKGWAVKKKRGIREWERNALLQGLGLAKIENKDGFVNTKVGFDGYYTGSDRNYGLSNPKGVPIPMLARSVEKGTSFQNGTNIIKSATNACRTTVISDMDEKLNEEIEKIMK